ncbi:MAG: hypothetical protein M3N42_03795 [Cyanobacteriota bacterium]|nr:hypothetical protein [Cyanobacteriota bacterium]
MGTAAGDRAWLGRQITELLRKRFRALTALVKSFCLRRGYARTWRLRSPIIDALLKKRQ